MNEWKPYSHAAMVDLAAAHIVKKDADVLGHLRDALENIGKAIDAVENGAKVTEKGDNDNV